MQSINISKNATITRRNGKYFYTDKNQYTGAIYTQEMNFNEQGKARVQHLSTSYSEYNKETIEVSFYVAGLKEEE